MQISMAFLTEDQKAMWAEAGTTFPGEQLEQVIDRAIADFPSMEYPAEHVSHLANDYYEIRRWDTPNGFDRLLKLQNTGRAKRHMEIDENGAREVLQIEVTLLDMVMTAIQMLLDVFLRLLGGTLKSSGQRKTDTYYQPPKPPEEATTKQEYVPTWKRQLIEHYEHTPLR